MPRDKERQDVWRYATVGTEFVATFGLFVAAGLWLDRRLSTLPIFTLASAALGFAGGLYRLIRQWHPGRPDRARYKEDDAPGGDRPPGR
jgi:F0F1-type ATP synthase assembly protein I